MTKLFDCGDSHDKTFETAPINLTGRAFRRRERFSG